MESKVSTALGRIGSGEVEIHPVSMLSDLSREEARELRTLWPAIPAQHREQAIRLMVELAEADVTMQFGRVFRAVLADPSPTVRQLAAGGLWEDASSHTQEVLLDLLEGDPSVDVRAEAATALGIHAEAAAMSDVGHETRAQILRRMIPLVSDPSVAPIVRRRCLETLGALGDEASVEDLIQQCYADEDESLVAGAIHAMGRSRSLQWLPSIIEMLESNEEEYRFEAARASGLLGDIRAIPELSVLLSDEDVEVRHAAISALGEIGGQAAIRMLRQLAEAGEAVDADVIEEALDQALINVNPLQSME